MSEFSDDKSVVVTLGVLLPGVQLQTKYNEAGRLTFLAIGDVQGRNLPAQIALLNDLKELYL